jgi:hypothetical protein
MLNVNLPSNDKVVPRKVLMDPGSDIPKPGLLAFDSCSLGIKVKKFISV